MENFTFVTNISNPFEPEKNAFENYVKKILDKKAKTAEAATPAPAKPEPVVAAKAEEELPVPEVKAESTVASKKACGKPCKGKKVMTKKKDKKASAASWEKVANLNPKVKSKLDKYWSTLYPRAYVNAMLADR